MKDIIQLKSPPKRLTFSKTAPPQLSSRQRGGTIFVSGIFEGVPVPMDKIAETQRVDLPFDVVGDFDIKLPNTQIRFTEDGPWGDPSKMAFDQPGHPTGKIKMLKVAGVQIVLEGPELHDGLLKTKDHGEIEFVMSGPGRVQPRATLTQIRKMREWLDVEADPEEIASAKRLKDMEESFRTKQHVDQYFRTNTANLDPIEGYWIQAAKHRNYDGTNFNCFIIRTDNNHFMEGSIVERDKVRFYTSSACQIVKTGQIYRYLPSSLSIESGHTEEHSSFQIANGVFSYTSGDAFQPDAGVGVTTHRFYRAEAGLRESTK